MFNEFTMAVIHVGENCYNIIGMESDQERFSANQISISFLIKNLCHFIFKFGEHEFQSGPTRHQQGTVCEI